jgi:hypothetical protein
MRTLTLRAIFTNYHRRILATYALTLLENLFELLYPSVTGLAVNGLVRHDLSGLTLLLGVWLVHTATSAVCVQALTPPENVVTK